MLFNNMKQPCSPLVKSIHSPPISICISDFTRHAKSQADQIVGQVGLPVFMGAFTLLGLAVTSSTEVIFGCVISNPIEVLAQIGGIVPISLSIFGVSRFCPELHLGSEGLIYQQF